MGMKVNEFAQTFAATRLRFYAGNYLFVSCGRWSKYVNCQPFS